MAQEIADPPTEMQAVLDKLGALDAKSFESSKLAERKAKDTGVKEFAKQMIADFTMAVDELKDAANLGDEAPQTRPNMRRCWNLEGNVRAGIPASDEAGDAH